ncbi:dihydrodipicolinate synthase family protein [Ornithinimicrobium sp. Y1847]|uniref:dihydrodipicolinate synthase family protein n=1 Tax=Ornithinimicrobium sp. Y1847 TaxID=3405419 RepID=UPI003B677879
MSDLTDKLRGVVPPVVTPFTPDGAVDHGSLERVVERLLAAGVDGIFALGSTAEVGYLTDAQRVEVVSRIVQTVGGRVPVLAGAIEITAARVAERARDLEQAGVDGVVATGPFYALNDEAEYAEHFRHVAAAVAVPLIAYDVPVRVNIKLSPALLVSLGQEGVICAVKDSSGDDVTFRRLIAANEEAGRPLRLFTGHEMVVDAMALAGADGVVPGLANVDPDGYVRLWRAATLGRWDEAVQEQEALNGLMAIAGVAVGRSLDAAGVGAFKAAMHHLGQIDHPTMAFPVRALDGEARAKVEQIVDRCGLAVVPA